MLFFQLYLQDNNSLGIHVSAGKEKKGRIVFEGTKKIYPQDLQKEFGDTLDTLIAMQIKNLKAKGHRVSIDTMQMNTLVFPEDQLMGMVKELSQTKRICFQDQKIEVSFDLTFYFKVIKINQDTIEVSSFFNDMQKTFSSKDCSFIHTHCCLYQGVVRFYKEVLEKRWLKLFQKEHVVLTEREKKIFLKDFSMQIFEKEEKKILPHPMLILKDAKGLFAELWMDYEGKCINVSDPVNNVLRNIEEEKHLQADLIEAGYERKNNESLYYCPQPKVFSALKLLVEIGWKILDHSKKEVILEKHHKIQLVEKEKCIHLAGEVEFQKGKSDISPIFSNLQRGQCLIDLGEKVGLIDRQSYSEKLRPFFEKKTLFLSKFDMASLKEIKDVHFGNRLQKLREAFLEDGEFAPVKLTERFQGRLLAYQEQGVRWLAFLYENGFSALLADEMGLGKTIQVLAFFSLLRNFFPVLIVAPKSLISNWLIEFKRFFPSASVYTYYGSNRKKCFDANSFILTTYGVLRGDWESLSHQKFSCVVLDESSFIKNEKTKTFQAATALNCSFRICLNGTPIENRVEDLINQYHFLLPGLIDKTISTDMLYKTIAPFLLRRTKDMVEIDLPEKIQQIVWVEMEDAQKKAYHKMLCSIRKEFPSSEAMKKKKMHVFEAILRLRQICCDPSLFHIEAPSAKLNSLLFDLESIASKHKIIIFSQFTKMLKRIKEALIGEKMPFLYLDGKTSAVDRATRVETFQSSEEPCIFLMSLKAAGYGLNLHSADYVFLFDPWWNEAVENQAIDRAHRIGRKHCLIAKRYLTLNSIEEKIHRLKQEKLSTAQTFIPQNLTAEDLYHLLS